MELPHFDLVLVEDNKIDSEVILHLLKKENPSWNCFVIDNGEEALHFFMGTGNYQNKSYPIPRLVLMDIKLPSYSGIEILGKIRQIAKLQYIPVVMLSSSSRMDDISQSYHKGANAYVVKPPKLNQMRQAVQAMTSFWLQTNTPLG